MRRAPNEAERAVISVEAARELIDKHCRPSPARKRGLVDALGLVCAKDILCPRSLPVFDNSAMDGFLLSAERTAKASVEDPKVFEVIGDVRAGDEPPGRVEGDSAYRIMTGAPVGTGGDAVLPVEKAQVRGGKLYVYGPLTRGEHVRLAGEEIQRGAIAVRKGTVINPGVVGFLASMGAAEIPVHEPPRVSVIATGSELIAVGGALRPGKIYDSNLPMIEAAIRSMGLRPERLSRLPDERRQLERAAAEALERSDVLLLTGGVSVGEYDLVKAVLGRRGVRTVFWGVSQKPGKPLYFGIKGSKLVFGLPGNPASVFTCFYEYVYPAVRRLMGFPRPGMHTLERYAEGALFPDHGKTMFLKSRLAGGGGVRLLQGQKSHMLSSLCEADSLAVLPSGPRREGGMISVHALPYAEAGRAH